MLILLTGPSGVGKNTIIQNLLKKHSNITFLKNYTTRQPRLHEINELSPYYFISKEEFEEKIKNNEFHEYEQIHDNYYGTLKQSIHDLITSTNHYIKDIGVLGQENFKKDLGDKVKIISIFLSAPREVLVERLKGRGETDIEHRLSRMDYEMAHRDNFDFVIENLDLEKTLSKIETIIKECEKN